MLPDKKHNVEPDLDELFRGIPDNLNITDLSNMLDNPVVPPAREKDPDRKKKKRLLFIWLSILLCSAVLLTAHHFGLFRYPWEKAPAKGPVVVGDLFPGAGDAQSGALSNMTKEDIMDQMQIAADANYFSFKINTLLELENGRGEAQMGIENPNYNVYPMVIQIHLGEDGAGDLLYDSGGILPDHHIDSAKLLKDLPKGVYEALATLYAYDPATQVNVFKSTAALTIHIKN